MKKALISIHLWTEEFLGTTEKAKGFLQMLKVLDGGRWFPDKWSQFEPIKNALTPDSEEQLLFDWVEERQGRISNVMCFKKKKPSLLLVEHSWRGRVPDLNHLWLDLEANEFVGAEGVARLKNIVANFVQWSGAAYATAWRSGQRHSRSAPGSPMKRLDQLNWLTFFGSPYLKLLGEDHIRNCPFYSCETLSNGLLLTAAERPNSLSMSESDDALVRLERCLGADVFATENYPEVGCRVPNFDLAKTVNFSTHR